MTVSELLERTSSAELSEWLAYLQLEREAETPDPADPDIWRKAFNANG